MRTTRKPIRRRFRRPPATIDRAVDLAIGAEDPAGCSGLVLVTRVGEAVIVPPRYEIADCSECGAACWLSSDVAGALRRRGMRILVLCSHCAAGTE